MSINSDSSTIDDGWNLLPHRVGGGDEPLPIWARAVAVHLPRTAAAMLVLDFAQRTQGPLDPVLRAKMRWAVARANRCLYAETVALSDLGRAGGDADSLTFGSLGWSESDRDAMEFARLLTVDALAVEDDVFIRLRDRFGDRGVAAMVLLAAYGNFQDRLLLGLSLPIEPQGPLPPIDVQFAPGTFQVMPVLPDQPEIPHLLADGETAVERDPEWSELSYETLQDRLEQQRRRTSRLPIPSWDVVKAKLPPEFTTRPTKIVWNLVCSGYVPELAIPWSIATRTMWAESRGDRVFEESLFWIQSRSVRCNYCMGHCEMLLEIAGLGKGAVAERTRHLASDDWSAFPPAEQRAYAFARTLTKTPWKLTPRDYERLEADLGSDRAMATFWWLCRGLYMTRVSDGFRLPLERDNVFSGFYTNQPAQLVAEAATSS